MNRSLRISLLAAATVALAASACTTERSLDSMYDESLPEGMQSSDGLRELRGDAFLSGDIGPVSDINNQADVTSYGEDWDGYKYDYVELNVYDDARGSWAMIGLNIQGGLDNAALRPGTTHTFSAFSEYGGGEEGDLYVDAIGCSDADTTGEGWDDEAYFDEPAEQVVLEVEPGDNPGSKQINVRTLFSGGQEAEGSFQVAGR